MKKIIIMFSFLLLLSISINAETSNSQNVKQSNGKPDISQELNLSDGQKQKIKDIHDKYVVQIKGLEKQNLSDKQKQDSFKEIMLKSRDEIAKILTPEQLETLSKLNGRG